MLNLFQHLKYKEIPNQVRNDRDVVIGDFMLEILNESSAQKEKFRIAANKMLNQCFLLKKKEDTKKDYLFVLQNKNLFISYFELLGYEIIINEDFGLISVKNTFGTGRLNLTKMQSILLLILRLLLLEKRNDLSSYSDEIVVLVQDIRDKYNVMKMKTELKKGEEKEIFALFKRYNLIRNIDSDISDSETRIQIYPSILMVTDQDRINELYEKTKSKLEEYTQEVMEDESENDAE